MSAGAEFVGARLADGWRVDALLARGGMAFVFRGEEIATGRGVAIKVPFVARCLEKTPAKRWFDRDVALASLPGCAPQRGRNARIVASSIVTPR